MTDPYAARRETSTTWTPTSLNRQARQILESELGQIVIEGELSGLARPSSGHLYFTLKDARAQVRCAYFKQRMTGRRGDLDNGQQVRVTAQLSLYEPRGDYQLIVHQVEAVGEGDLRRQYDALKLKLKAAGLFDTDRKRALPRYPKHIVLVSSQTAAAVQDVIHVLSRRWSLLKLGLEHASVQGKQAAGELINALQRAEQRRPDIILLTRGGGSLEDLWSFNDEALAHAIANCSVPVVSAVGHQTDVSISDFVADLAAPTPSAAAELMVPDKGEILDLFASYSNKLQHEFESGYHRRIQQLDVLRARLERHHPGRRLAEINTRVAHLRQQLDQQMRHRLQRAAQELRRVRQRLDAHHPQARMTQLTERLSQLSGRFDREMHRSLQAAGQRIVAAIKTLEAVNPLQVLRRGYSLSLNDAGQAITSSDQVTVGQTLTTRLSEGSLVSKVTHVKPEGA